MSDARRTPVAVVGSGPVGLMLALHLDRHGVPTVVFDTDDSAERRPRGRTFGPRAMEHCRRLGLAGAIRRLGLPADHPADIACFTRYHRHELVRLRSPSTVARLRHAAAAPRAGQLPEPAHCADEMYVRQLLHEHARTRPNITLRPGRQVTRLAQNAELVTVRAEHPAHPCEQWTARYAVLADGARDLARHALGIRDTVPGALGKEAYGRQGVAAHLRLPTFHRDVSPARRPWSHWAVNPDHVTNLLALDGADQFLLLCGATGPAGPEQITALLRQAAGDHLPVEVLGHAPWLTQVALVAERFRTGRIFLAGDSAHLSVPDGGLGLSTGVDDAVNLAWKLAAVLQGWGGRDLLTSYEGERRPVALRNTTAAHALHTVPTSVPRPAGLEEDTAEGQARRDRAGALLRSYGERSHALGIHLGARYDGSPVIAPSPGAEPLGDSWGTYAPTSVPGGRAPHVWLDDWHGPGSSLFDRFGSGYTLLRLGPEAPTGKPMQAAAQACGMPLKVLDVDGGTARDLYERDLVLIRPDQHVAWRGNQLPPDPGDLVALVSGARPARWARAA